MKRALLAAVALAAMPVWAQQVTYSDTATQTCIDGLGAQELEGGQAQHQPSLPAAAGARAARAARTLAGVKGR